MTPPEPAVPASRKLQITYDESTGTAAIAVAAYTSVPGGPAARVAFDLTTDPVPPIKRREGESDDAYAARAAKHLPAAVQVPVEYFAGIAERCKDILEGLGDITAHHGQRAALEHALLAEGKTPPGVKQLKVGGSLGSIGGADAKKV